jgi:hypothetical protein
MDTDAQYFLEGTAATDVQIMSNTFQNTSAYDGAIWISANNPNGIVSTPVEKNIEILNNTFQGLLGPAIQLNSANTVWIDGNTIADANLGTAGNYLIGTASTSGSIMIADSSNVGGTNVATGSSGPVSVDSSTTSSIGVRVQ